VTDGKPRPAGTYEVAGVPLVARKREAAVSAVTTRMSIGTDEFGDFDRSIDLPGSSAVCGGTGKEFD
jgi:hypothetical protein